MIALMRSFKLALFMMRLTIVGFGNQAKSWAQNLQDSGARVRVALRSGSHSALVSKKLGFEVVEIGSAEFFEDTAFALLTPDHTHADFLREFGKGFKTSSLIVYAHGFSCLEGDFPSAFPDLRHVLFAPKAIGTELRRQFQIKGKLGAVYSLDFVSGDKKTVEEWVKRLAQDLGINMGPFPTTFLRETQADLYSEQGLLCSLIPYTAAEMFEHLVDQGVEPELAYFECWHELKLIVNAMVEMGPLAFFDLISPNALIGSEKGYQKLMTPEFKQNLKNLLQDIQTGAFNQELSKTSLEETRHKIRGRWEKSALTKTFTQMNQENK